MPRKSTIGCLLIVFAIATSAFADDKQISRRNFLGCSALLFLGIGVNTVAASSLDKIVNGFEMRGDKPTYSVTILESNLMTMGTIILSMMLRSVGIRSGNASSEEIEKIILETPLNAFFRIVVVAPIIEEMMFRAFPRAVFGDNWVNGIASSLIFAGLHMENSEGIDVRKIPAPQLVAGIFFWYLMRERGISHSVISHMAHNNTHFISIHLSHLFPNEAGEQE